MLVNLIIMGYFYFYLRKGSEHFVTPGELTAYLYLPLLRWLRREEAPGAAVNAASELLTPKPTRS